MHKTMMNPNQDAPSSTESKAPAPSILPDKPLLLIVDDQSSNRQLLIEMFRNHYELCVASSGQEAIALCRDHLPDLVLLDVVMPDMDGVAVCRQLKGDVTTQDIPVIFITINDDPATEARCLDAGGVDFIRKPFHIRAVKARVRTHLALKHQSDTLRTLALVDGLTGVANRRHFDLTLKSEWRRCLRAGQPLSLIMADVDFFKNFNDHYGHQAGDVCLQSIAAASQAEFIRSHDLIARYGGEEFVCILPDTPLEGAVQKAEALEQAIRALAIPHEKSDAGTVVTVSIGVATIQPFKGKSADDLLAAADAQMYLAKQAGRAQVKSLQLV